MDTDREYLYIPKEKDLNIVFFGGMGSFKGLTNINDSLPFEMSHFMSNNYKNVSRLFFVDYFQCWYSKGFFKKPTTLTFCCEFIKKKFKIIKEFIFVEFQAVDMLLYYLVLY